jgi:hypothetical protein
MAEEAASVTHCRGGTQSVAEEAAEAYDATLCHDTPLCLVASSFRPNTMVASSLRPNTMVASS